MAKVNLDLKPINRSKISCKKVSFTSLFTDFADKEEIGCNDRSYFLEITKALDKDISYYISEDITGVILALKERSNLDVGLDDLLVLFSKIKTIKHFIDERTKICLEGRRRKIIHSDDPKDIKLLEVFDKVYSKLDDNTGGTIFYYMFPKGE